MDRFVYPHLSAGIFTPVSEPYPEDPQRMRHFCYTGFALFYEIQSFCCNLFIYLSEINQLYEAAD